MEIALIHKKNLTAREIKVDYCNDTTHLHRYSLFLILCKRICFRNSTWIISLIEDQLTNSRDNDVGRGGCVCRSHYRGLIKLI